MKFSQPFTLNVTLACYCLAQFIGNELPPGSALWRQKQLSNSITFPYSNRPGVGRNLQDYLLSGPTRAMDTKTLSGFTNDPQLLTEAIVQ